MERDRFIHSFYLREEEKLYKKLYLQNPKIYEEPVRSWGDFLDRFMENNEEGEINLPQLPPTPIENRFTEEEYFSQEIVEETNIVVNARYCPAFLHGLEFIKLIYVFQGSCLFYYSGKWIDLQAGNICIVAPEVEQTVFSHSDEDIVINLLIRRSSFTEAFPELLEINEGGIIAEFFWKMIYHRRGAEVMVFHSKPYKLLEESVMELYEETFLLPKKSRLVMKSMMTAIFGYILRINEEEAVSLKDNKKIEKYPLIQYQQYMKQYIDTVSLTTLSKEFFVSEGYLSRYFKKETGYTFSHILLEMRMKKAAELLINTECNMERIISLIGYRDQSIFFRNFKEAYGMTPAVYRKKKRQAEVMRVL